MQAFKWILAVLILVAIAVAGIWYVGEDRLETLMAGLDEPARDQQGQPQATPVNVAKSQRREIRITVEAIGTLRAKEQVILTSQVSGLVQEIHFQEGQWVDQGDLLVELDAEHEQAELAEAVAERDEARRQYQRGQELRRERVISQSRYDELKASYETAQARVNVAQAELNDRQIVAPFAGVIGLRQISPGALLEPGDPVATLNTVDPIDLEFNVPSELLPRLTPGLAVIAQAEGFAGQRFEGELIFIDTRIHPDTRSVTLKAELPNPEGLLRPGLFMTVELVLETREDAIVVPEEALLLQGQDKYVFVVQDDGTVSRTLVETGERRRGIVEIRSGVEAGSQVVVGGLQKIGDGQKVRPTPAQAPGQGG